MSMTRLVAMTASIGISVVSASVAYAQDYPNKPIRILTGAPGGAADIACRHIAPSLSANVGQPVIIDNIFAPAKMPMAIVNRLNPEIVRVLRQTDVKAQLLNFGMETTDSSPDQFAATVKSEIAKWSKLIKETGIKVQ